MTNVPRHYFEEHTGEVQLRIAAPSLPQLFEEAGVALAELMAERLANSSGETTETVAIQAPDREALLVDWLNELIFRSETQQKIYHDIHIIHLSETELRAEIRGVSPERMRTAVKAATFHRIKIQPEMDGFSATVVLDV